MDFDVQLYQRNTSKYSTGSPRSVDSSRVNELMFVSSCWKDRVAAGLTFIMIERFYWIVNSTSGHDQFFSFFLFSLYHGIVRCACLESAGGISVTLSSSEGNASKRKRCT